MLLQSVPWKDLNQYITRTLGWAKREDHDLNVNDKCDDDDNNNDADDSISWYL